MKIKNKVTWMSIFLLIFIEQAIKVMINHKYLDADIPILAPILYFDPMFNRDYSWFNSMLQLGVSRWIHIAIVFLMSMLIFLFYQYINKRLGSNRIVNIMFAFLFSGATCSLIDKLFWNGSLDYIRMNGWFTFDLKDIYIDVFIGLVILFMLVKNKTLKQMDDKNLLKDFVKYILRKS